MRNKIFTFLGIFVVLIAVGAYFLFDANIKQNSNAMGFNVLVAKTNIAEGTVIKNIQQANELFSVKRITQAEAVPSAIQVNVINKQQNGGLVDSIKNFFVPAGVQVSPEDLKNLVNKKVTSNIYKNEQVLKINLSSDTVELKEGERYFAIPVDYITAVGAEVQKGDYVDIWIYYTDKNATKPNTSEKVMGPLKVVKVKDANNLEITGNSKEIPKLVVFKMSETDITTISEKMNEGTLFLTKWGYSPSSVTDMKAAENAKTEVSAPANTK